MRIDVVVQDLLGLYELRLAALSDRSGLRRGLLDRPRRLRLLLRHCRPLLNERCLEPRAFRGRLYAAAAGSGQPGEPAGSARVRAPAAADGSGNGSERKVAQRW